MQILEDSLEGQRNGYEARLKAQTSDYETEIAQLRQKLEDDREKAAKNVPANWLTAEDLPTQLQASFYRLNEEWQEGQRRKLALEREDLLQGKPISNKEGTTNE